MTVLSSEEQHTFNSEPDNRLQTAKFASGGNPTLSQKTEHPSTKREPSKDLTPNEIVMRQSLDGRF
jgi:hypothetical protein